MFLFLVNFEDEDCVIFAIISSSPFWRMSIKDLDSPKTHSKIRQDATDRQQPADMSSHAALPHSVDLNDALPRRVRRVRREPFRLLPNERKLLGGELSKM